MSRVCPQCNQIAAESLAFCIRCGYRFQGNEQVVNEEATIRQASLSNLSPDADPAATWTQGSQQARPSQPAIEQAPGASTPTPAVSAPLPAVSTPIPPASVPVYAQPASPSAFAYSPAPQAPAVNPAPGAYAVPGAPQQGVYPPQAYGQMYTQMAATPVSGGVASLQRAFAGKGTPVHHQSWMIDGKQIQPASLRGSLIDNIYKQGIPGVSVTPEHLREQGVIMEERDFVKVQYNITSIFVYLAPVGQNLYISRTSTVQQPVSRARLVVLGGLFILMLLSLIFYIVINPSDADLASGAIGPFGFAGAVKTIFSYLFDGLLIFFFFVLLRSVVSWLTENDFLAFLRPNRLNDFTLDTLSSIEYIADKGIRETLRHAGLNADGITTPDQNYAPQQPLRRF